MKEIVVLSIFIPIFMMLNHIRLDKEDEKEEAEIAENIEKTREILSVVLGGDISCINFTDFKNKDERGYIHVYVFECDGIHYHCYFDNLNNNIRIFKGSELIYREMGI